jgi:hypothetical protein
VIGFADFDGDGFLDLLGVDYFGDDIVVIWGMGGGNFGPSTGIGIRKSRNPVVGDFNEDGLLDVAVYEGEEIGPGIKVAVNRGTEPSPRSKKTIAFRAPQWQPPTLTMTATWTSSTAPVRCF